MACFLSIKHVGIESLWFLFHFLNGLCTNTCKLENDFFTFLKTSLKNWQEQILVLVFSQFVAEWLYTYLLKSVIDTKITPCCVIYLKRRDVIEQGRIIIEVLKSPNYFWEFREGFVEIIFKCLAILRSDTDLRNSFLTIYSLELVCSLDYFKHGLSYSWFEGVCESICFSEDYCPHVYRLAKLLNWDELII